MRIWADHNARRQRGLYLGRTRKKGLKACVQGRKKCEHVWRGWLRASKYAREREECRRECARESYQAQVWVTGIKGVCRRKG